MIPVVLDAVFFPGLNTAHCGHVRICHVRNWFLMRISMVQFDFLYVFIF